MKLSIIPKPKEFNIHDEEFDLTGSISVINEFELLNNLLYELIGNHTNLTIKDGVQQKIKLEKDVTYEDSAYQIKVDSNEITLISKDSKGMFYALMTLRQLFAQTKTLPHLLINDEPKYNHRGFMVDVSRHFIPKDEIKRLIDIASLHKLNIFHWHLTDDQGWRIEIKKYPELAKLGSARTKSIVDAKDMYRDFEVSGYYTQEDIKEVVEYAKERFIDIIPEIDIPGHTSAVTSVYPKLSCHHNEHDIPHAPGIYSEILCAGSTKVEQFVYNVLDEVIELFPYHKIHIGGDEVSKTNWITCDKCIDTIKKNNLETPANLQFFFMNNVVKYIESKGKKVILWNDAFNNDEFSKDTICQYWFDGKENKNIQRAVSNKLNIINSDFRAYYFDYPYSHIPLRKTYEHQNQLLSNYPIDGYECCLWTEWVPSRQRIDYLLFPRLFAVAEIAWTSLENQNYIDFEKRLNNLGSYYQKLNVSIPPKKDYDIEGLKAKIKTVKHFRKMINLNTIKVLLKMKKENSMIFKD